MFKPRKRSTNDGIPTASMSDVAFLLLIFFLSTTKFDMKNGLGLVLPGPVLEDSQRARIDDKNLTKILVNREGEVAVNNDIVSLMEMDARVRELVLSNPEMVFSYKIDRQCKYVHFVTTLDRLKLAGAERITLSTN